MTKVKKKSMTKVKRARGFYVVIFESFDDVDCPEVEVETLGPYASATLADKADDGVNRNLNHDRFFTRIVGVS